MEIYQKYTDNITGEGVIVEEADKKREAYEKELDNFRNLQDSEIDETTFSRMKKVTLDAIDDTKEFRRQIGDRIITECNEKLIQYTDDPRKIPAEAYTPNFTETDFDKIDEDAKNETSGYNNVETGLTFKKVETVPYHHMREHVKRVADSIHDRLNNDIIPIMIDNVVDYVTKCCQAYTTKLTEHKQELETEYNKLLADKESNERRIENVHDLERKVEIVGVCMAQISEVIGELKNYVGE